MSSRTSSRLLALAVLTAATLPAASAQAASYRYNVTVRTTVDYKLHKAWGTGRDGGDRHFQFSSDLYSELRGVEFIDGALVPYVNGAQVEESNSGFYAAEDRSPSSPTKHLHCAADPEQTSPWGRASLDATGLDRRTIALRVTDKLQYDGNCDDGRSPGYGITSIDGAAEDYDGPFDQVFSLPAEAIGQGKIIHLLESTPVTKETCPGRDELTTSCAFSWTAEVTFLRADLPEQPPYLPSPEPSPAPATPATSAGTGALIQHVTDAIKDYLDEQRIADSIAKAFRDSHKPAKVQLDCPGPCSGTVSAYAVATANATPTGKPLATATFGPAGGGRRLAAGDEPAASPMLAALRFTAADRRALGKRRYVALRFAMRTGADPTVRRAAIVLKLRGR